MLNAVIFYHIGLTGRWYAFSLSYLAGTAYYALRLLYAFGFDRDLTLVVFSKLFCFTIHIGICYEEEMRLRAHFYSEQELKDTKDAFQGTVEALPEPLVVKSGRELILTNLSFR